MGCQCNQPKTACRKESDNFEIVRRERVCKTKHREVGEGVGKREGESEKLIYYVRTYHK